MGKWMRANGPALLMLTFVFLLALFIRSYFAYDMSADNDYIVSGGSDSYYWRRIIDFHVETGESLFWDPLLNYPDGLINPRPPFFSMSVAVPAVLLESLFDSIDDSVGFFFVWSTAFWGALTVVPVYFMGKEAFGRRVGMAAALFFAIIPAHVQRSVLSNADHDSIILFLIVTIFYFLLKSIRLQEHKKWVEKWSWNDRKAVAAGLRGYLSGSRPAIMYALMAGTAYAALMMTWVGFAYVTVIILIYYIVQLFMNMF
ncbi:MAG: STT3 domain-containing protein, partial [Thermoplasmata archaeon]